MSYNSVPTYDPADGEKQGSTGDVSKRGMAKYVLAVGVVALAGAAAVASVRSNHKSGGTLLRQQSTSSSSSSSSSSCTERTTGPVLKGYDLVAYHQLEDGADGVTGKADIKALWGESGAEYTFHFSTVENKELFLADPKKYLPAYGGFCAWGIGEESWWTAETLGPNANPNVWKILDGRLYVFMFSDPKMRFMGELTGDDLDASGDTKKYAADGERRWSSWFPDAESEVMNTGCFWFDKYTDGK
jgi:hypothetical protein